MDAETKGYNEGYADGRAYYTNDISKEIFKIKQGIYAIEKYSKGYWGEMIEELEEAIRILEIVLENSKDRKFLETESEV